MNFRDGKELLAFCKEHQCKISEAMIEREVQDINGKNANGMEYYEKIN